MSTVRIKSTLVQLGICTLAYLLTRIVLGWKHLSAAAPSERLGMLCVFLGSAVIFALIFALMNFLFYRRARHKTN